MKELLAEGMKYPFLVTSGGVSVGKYDLVREILGELGAQIKFWKVAIKPGMPTLFARRAETLVFGLPGYPVASVLCFEHFIRPALAKALGGEYLPLRLQAVLERDLKLKPGRRRFVRASLRCDEGKYYTAPLKGQGSGILSALAQADCLIVVPGERTFLPAGEKVTVQLLEKD